MSRELSALPHDEEAEKAFLGCILLGEAPDSPDLEGIINSYSADLFYSFKHKKIFEAAKSLLSEGKAVNIISVCDYFREKRLLEEAGGESYISLLISLGCIPSQARQYLEILTKFSKKRKLAEIGYNIIDETNNGKSPEEILEKLNIPMEAMNLPVDPSISIQPRPISVALKETSALIYKYISLPNESQATFITFWILGTYCYCLFSYYGYLALRSATPRCGKSKLLRLIALFCKGHPSITVMPTAASLFRSKREILIIDEVDKLRNQDKETYGDVLAVLNAGFEKGGVVERTEKTKAGFEVKQYKVFGPKALAGIEALADTLADRSYQIQMVRTPQRMPRLNLRKLEKIAQQIRTDFEAFAKSNCAQIEKIYSQLPDEISHLSGFDDRLQDISEPLLVLASVVDAGLLPEEKQFLSDLLEGLKMVAGRRGRSNKEESLLALLEILEPKLNQKNEVFITTAELLEAFKEREEISWIENGRALSSFLKHFDLCPGSSGRARGYRIYREWVDGWKVRYKNGN